MAKTMFVVMTAFPFSSIKCYGRPLPKSPKGEPQMFMPVFDTYEEARAWAKDGSDIMEMGTKGNASDDD